MIEETIERLKKIKHRDSYKYNLETKAIISDFLLNSFQNNNPESIPLLENYLSKEYIKSGIGIQNANHTIYWNLLCSANDVSLHFPISDFFKSSTSLDEYKSYDRKIELM